jgi:Tfp pilus assembly protein PilX
MPNFSPPILASQRFSRPLPSRQKGATLLIGMSLLIVITLFALAAIRGIMLQERIAGGFYDREIAFSAAEKTLRWAERAYMLKDSALIIQPSEKIPSFVVGTSVPDTKAYFDAKNLLTFDNIKASLTSIGGQELPNDQIPPGGFAGSRGEVYGKPLYLAVDLSNSGDCDQAVRINAVGVGRNKNTVVVLESIVCKF